MCSRKQFYANSEKFLSSCCEGMDDNIFMFETTNRFLFSHDGNWGILRPDNDVVPLRFCPECGARLVTCCKECQYRYSQLPDLGGDECSMPPKWGCACNHREIADIKIFPEWCPEIELEIIECGGEDDV